MSQDRTDDVELSVVIPCLNEADTIGICVKKARQVFSEQRIAGEVIVADNGSTDGSDAIAREAGARVIGVEAKGYGNALMGGIESARGTFIIMGDADESYDFLEIPRFLEKLREGYNLVQGCRLPAGGGAVKPGAMPFLHRWLGNPMFSALARWWFRAGVHDIYCGMRGFTRELYNGLGLRCTGMEFATEMIIKASMYRERIAEVPITLHADGRRAHSSHLRTFRDGWRTLRFFLMYSPRWLFLAPGLFLIALGLLGYAVALPGLTAAGITFGGHTLLFASVAILCGYQSILFAILTKTFVQAERLAPPDPRIDAFFRFATLERGLLAGFAALIFGVVLLLVAVNEWRSHSFGRLDYATTMRWVIPGATMTALGAQTILFSFFASIVGLRRR